MTHHDQELKKQRRRLLWLFVILFVVLMLIWSFGTVFDVSIFE